MKKTVLAMLCLAVFSCERDKEPVQMSLLKHEGSSTVETRSSTDTGTGYRSHEFQAWAYFQNYISYEEANRLLLLMVNKVYYPYVGYTLSAAGSTFTLRTSSTVPSNLLSDLELESAANYFFDKSISELSQIPGINKIVINPIRCYSLNPPTGGGGGTSQPVVAPKAKRILRNSNMSEENWKIIENMIEKIMADCMGGALYSGLVNALNGGTLPIEFGAGSSFDFGSGKLTLDINQSQSNILFHELFHAYQSYQETHSSVMSSFINQEAEARCAQYMYLSKLPEFQPGSEWYDWYDANNIMKATRALARQLTSKGQFSSSQEITIFNTHASLMREITKDPEYWLYDIDYNRSAAQNFRNIQYLARNC